MFKIIVDSASNLTEDIAKKYDIEVVSYKCTINGELYLCYEEGRDDAEDGKEFYDKIRAGADVKTSLISPAILEEVFEKYLKQGIDVLFLTISAELSGTYQSGVIACEDMNDMYPDNKCIVVDSKGASLGEGFLAIEAAKMRDMGKSIDDAVKYILDNQMKMRHIFTVDDLKYLKKGGRISPALSVIGTILNIKPILYASDEAKIDLASTVRGRKKSLDALVNNYLKYAVDTENSIFGVAHCDCEEDAEYIISRVQKERPPKEIINVYYDRCSGTHVGPGAICIFFMGNNRDMK